MFDNYTTFSSVSKQTVRVSFDSDGTAWYCCNDIAALIGYKAPNKAILYAESVEDSFRVEKRKFIWPSTKGRCRRNYSSIMRCFNEESALRFLERVIESTDAVRWFTLEVIPTARVKGAEIAKANIKKLENTKNEISEGEISENAASVQKPIAEVAASKPESPHTLKSITERLDAIILECALLKKELLQTK